MPCAWRNTLEVVLVLDNDREMIILGGIKTFREEMTDNMCTSPVITKRGKKKLSSPG